MIDAMSEYKILKYQLTMKIHVESTVLPVDIQWNFYHCIVLL